VYDGGEGRHVELGLDGLEFKFDMHGLGMRAWADKQRGSSARVLALLIQLAHARMHVWAHVCVCMRMCACVHARARARVCVCLCARARACVYVCVSAHVHAGRALSL